KGTPNKLPKGERALVKLDAAEREVRVLVRAGEPITDLGKDRLAVLDAWAYSLAQKFAPLEDKEGNVSWRNEGDEVRFMRFMSCGGKCAAARAQFESPRYAAFAVANQGEKIPDITRVCKAWARVPAGIANARARSVAAPIANREQQKSTGGGRKCSQLFPVEHEGGVRAGSPPRRRGLCRPGSWPSS